VSAYSRLRNDRPRTVPDLTAKWQRFTTFAAAGEEPRTAVARFCERKLISVESLEALGTRVMRHHDYGWCLAYAGDNGRGQITAIKYRPLGGTSHEGWAELGSWWVRPIVVGNVDSLDWLVAEGETDAARLHGLVGDRCAILVLPTGALVFRPEWAAWIPRGATVALCHDADEDGDAGADAAAKVLGGKTLRVRPPVDGGDWCDWAGSAEEFVRMATPQPRFEFVPFNEFAVREFPVAEPLLGEPGTVYLAIGSLFMAYGTDGSGKSTFLVDVLLHLAAGEDWLGIKVPRPVRVCIIENEGPPGLFQGKLDDKLEHWTGADPRPNMYFYTSPWGDFSFADAEGRMTLKAYCDEHEIDLVAANPTLALGVGMSGRPDETQQFVEWLIECGLWRNRAFWLNHHENKAGQISGDWGRHPDTRVLLQQDGNRQRTKLTWRKTRWASLAPDERTMTLEWVVDGQGYSVIQPDAVGATEEELDRQIAVYLVAHPRSTTAAVHRNVTGTNSRITARLRGRFESVPGRGNAVLWVIPADRADDLVGTCYDQPTSTGENTDE
jgi:AAA domain